MSKTRIIDAVRKLDLGSTKELLDTNPSLLTVTDQKGRNLLHLACSASCKKLNVSESVSAQMVAFLLDGGLDVESPFVTSDGCDTVNALWFAVARGRNRTLVKLLIKRGATPNGLYAAGWWEDIEILDLLIRSGAPVDVHGGDTPFLACWNWRRFDAAKFLARKGANVNFQDAQGKTALHHGVEKKFDPSLLEWLVRHGASPDIKDNNGESAKGKASRKRDKRFLNALL
jgi:ankyrin repeat protein